MPFKRTPPQSLLDKFVNKLRERGVHQDPNTIEADVDRVFRALSAISLLEEQCKRMPPQVVEEFRQSGRIPRLKDEDIHRASICSVLLGDYYEQP